EEEIPELEIDIDELLELTDAEQRSRLHELLQECGKPKEGESWLSWVFEKVVLVMVCYFILSIINSMAQSYAKRLQQKKYSEEKMK
ncbi:hypothetical protein cypCar_00015626, partial [Cyprinus carpio]